MKKSLKYRGTIPDSRRIVVKMGTRVLVQKSGKPEIRRMRALVAELARIHRAGHEVAVVTSGAIGAGMEALRMKQRPTALQDLQMAASVGQCRLMAKYDKLFAEEHCTVGQVLLTHDNFNHKIRMTNARRTIENLLRNRVIPIINENDVVSDEEIRADMSLGDNDRLSALVVKLVRADLLVILTTVNGVVKRHASGRLERVRYLESITPATFKLVMGNINVSNLSKGGMHSKLQAAQTASRSGASVVIADGRKPGELTRVMRGDDVGTFVLASV